MHIEILCVLKSHFYKLVAQYSLRIKFQNILVNAGLDNLLKPGRFACHSHVSPAISRLNHKLGAGICDDVIFSLLSDVVTELLGRLCSCQISSVEKLSILSELDVFSLIKQDIALGTPPKKDSWTIYFKLLTMLLYR